MYKKEMKNKTKQRKKNVSLSKSTTRDINKNIGQSSIKIYTDGSARGNPGRAGWGAVFIIESDLLKEKSKPKSLAIKKASIENLNRLSDFSANIHKDPIKEIGEQNDISIKNKIAKEIDERKDFATSGRIIKEIGGRSDFATNNQMELTAVIEALKFLEKNKIKSKVEIFSDSKYVILGISEWIYGWMKNDWRNSAKKIVLNRELWEELFKLTNEFKPKWTYVAGHKDNKHNNRADEIATSFADDLSIKLKN